MRILRSSAMLLALFGLVAFVGCQSSEQRAENKAELEKLSGKWSFASRDGDEANPDEEDEAPEKKPDQGLVYAFDGENLKLTSDGVAFRWYRVTVSPGKDPKQIDLLEVDEKGSRITSRVNTKVASGKKKGKPTTKSIEYRQVGVYQIDGDNLKLALNHDTKKRPSGFESAGRGQYVVTLKKVKDGSEPKKTEKDKGEEKPKDKGEEKDKEEKAKDKGGAKPKEKEEKDD